MKVAKIATKRRQEPAILRAFDPLMRSLVPLLSDPSRKRTRTKFRPRLRPPRGSD